MNTATQADIYHAAGVALGPWPSTCVGSLTMVHVEVYNGNPAQPSGF